MALVFAIKVRNAVPMGAGWVGVVRRLFCISDLSTLIKQTITKHLSELGIEPGVRNKNKTWFLPSKGPQSNERWL